MTTLTVAAVQAAYVLMDREATVARVETLTTEAAAMGDRDRVWTAAPDHEWEEPGNTVIVGPNGEIRPVRRGTRRRS